MCQAARTPLFHKKHLQLKGVWPSSCDIAEQPEEVEAKNAVDAELPKQATEDELSGFDWCGHDMTVVLHRNYGHWHKVPPRHVRAMLHIMEPISLHSRMIKLLCFHGQREAPREPMLQMLEFCTGIDTNEALPSQHVGTLTLMCRNLNDQRGNRLRNFRVASPIDWNRKELGVYIIREQFVKQDGERVKMLLLIDRFLNKSVVVPWPKNKAFASLLVMNNFADLRAYVGCRSEKEFKMPCSVLIAANPQADSESEEEEEKKDDVPLQLLDQVKPEQHDDDEVSDPDDDENVSKQVVVVEPPATVQSPAETSEEEGEELGVDAQVQPQAVTIQLCKRPTFAASAFDEVAEAAKSTASRAAWACDMVEREHHEAAMRSMPPPPSKKHRGDAPTGAGEEDREMEK